MNDNDTKEDDRQKFKDKFRELIRSTLCCRHSTYGEMLISDDYFPRIVDACLEDILDNMWETADHVNWNMDDVALSFGRVLCDRLGIE